MTPHDEFAERAVLGEILRTETVPDELRALMNPDDVWTPDLRSVAEAAFDLGARGKPCDPVSVRTELLRRGIRTSAVDAVWLVDLLRCGQPSYLHHARSLRDLSVRRQVITEAQRAIQQAESPAVDPYEIAAITHMHLEELAGRSDPPRATPLTDAHDFITGPVAYDWLVPDLLERGDRLLITAGEGVGKSVLTRQIAVMVAAGLHPFTQRFFDPKPVLLVDLENGTRHLRRALLPLVERATTSKREISRGRLHIESRPSGIDLTRTEDEAWLNRVCEAAQPELVVIGPLYRMHATDMAKEEPARHLTRALDGIRGRFGCALVVETHAPHGNGPGPRNLRPVGSSLFMRWPEFGYGISQSSDDGVYDLKTWRGARDARTWPTQLRWGSSSEWPWVPFRREWQDGVA